MSKMLVQRSSVQVNTTFGSLLRELQRIWDEVGETETEMEKMLQELEQECLEVYRRKVEQASHVLARLHQSVAEKKVERATLLAALGEHPALSQAEKNVGTLKEQLAAITPQVEELRLKKQERIKQLTEVESQIHALSSQISGCSQVSESEHLSNSKEDLSVRRLDDLYTQRQSLQKEKSDRLHKVLEFANVLHELCAVLGLEFAKTISEVHPSLIESGSARQPKSITNETIEKLSSTIDSLVQERQQRLQTLQTLATSLTELWKLLDTPPAQQERFRHVIDCIGASDFHISSPGGLSLEIIEEAKKEMQNLENLKMSKMKELVLKKRLELEDVCRRAHMEPDASTAPDKTNALIESGMVDASELLANLEEQIVEARKEANSRKEILDKVTKWLSACEEESWLEDYNMDNNRYNASKGAHINLKRAERARITVTKLPGLVDLLRAKARIWEKEKGACFVFDGVRLLSMLDDYVSSRHEREEEKRRTRDLKRMQEHLLTELETFYGSRPSPSKSRGRPRTPSTPATPRRLSTPHHSTSRSSFRAPPNFVAMQQQQQHHDSSDPGSPFTTASTASYL